MSTDDFQINVGQRARIVERVSEFLVYLFFNFLQQIRLHPWSRRKQSQNEGTNVYLRAQKMEQCQVPVRRLQRMFPMRWWVPVIMSQLCFNRAIVKLLLVRVLVAV